MSQTTYQTLMHPTKSNLALCVALASMLSRAAFAQAPADGAGARSGENRPQPLRRPPVSPIVRALDANGDGEISAEEIANASAALKTLDQNKDGKLDQSEMRPGFSGGAGFGGPPPGFGPGGPGGMRGGGESSMSAEEEVKRYMTLDKNGDGKLTKDEVPARMQGLFTRADLNSDGIITKEEIEQLVK